ncbi:hypothetical protein RGU12_20805 [Fredinandcohnia sp. QZ13]|nr:hypothetical protein [Fredinandcohnia sp. QZ13]MDR4889939.1 hypothetical protein [Fredinandcohnia sp. QZ13]
MNNASEIIETVMLTITMWFTLQFVSYLVVFLLGNVMVEHLE